MKFNLSVFSRWRLLETLGTWKEVGVHLTRFLYGPMSLTRESSILKIPYGSCWDVSFWLTRLELRFTPLSNRKLLDLDTLPDFSGSDTRDVLINLKKMQSRHFIRFSDNLLGCIFGPFFSDNGFTLIEGLNMVSVFMSDTWKKKKKWFTRNEYNLWIKEKLQVK